MKEYYCDLHLHGLYAGGVSKHMRLPVMAEQARLKGLDVLGTADILHKKWMEHARQNLVEESNGEYWDCNKQARFIIQTEVEDAHRVHHLIYFPDLSCAEELRAAFEGKGNLDCIMCGRSRLRLNAEEIAEQVEKVGGIIGPAHAFTPYTGLYAHWTSVKEAYGKMGENIFFLELGLSADSALADRIQENHRLSFLSCSDAHSPWPNRVGREFTKVKMRNPVFAELKHALKKPAEKRISLNVGLDPKEGKYHLTACNVCYKKYSPETAKELGWKCTECTGQIKKGVKDRILELANRNVQPDFRPKYVHSLPLAEIIQSALKIKNPNSIKVQGLWKKLVSAFGTEIAVLIDAPIQEISACSQETGEKIEAFRNGWVLYRPGGGGLYGTPIIATSRHEYNQKKQGLANQLHAELTRQNQTKLKEF